MARQAMEVNYLPLLGMMIAGFLIARFAGPLARALTFDSEPR